MKLSDFLLNHSSLCLVFYRWILIYMFLCTMIPNCLVYLKNDPRLNMDSIRRRPTPGQAQKYSLPPPSCLPLQLSLLLLVLSPSRQLPASCTSSQFSLQADFRQDIFIAAFFLFLVFSSLLFLNIPDVLVIILFICSWCYHHYYFYLLMFSSLFFLSVPGVLVIIIFICCWCSHHYFFICSWCSYHYPFYMFRMFSSLFYNATFLHEKQIHRCWSSFIEVE